MRRETKGENPPRGPVAHFWGLHAARKHPVRISRLPPQPRHVLQLLRHAASPHHRFPAQGQAEKMHGGAWPVSCSAGSLWWLRLSPGAVGIRIDRSSRPPLAVSRIRPCVAAPSPLHTCTRCPLHPRISDRSGRLLERVLLPPAPREVAAAECHSSIVTSAAATCSPLSPLPKPHRAWVEGVSSAHREEVGELPAGLSRLPRVPPDPRSALTAAGA